MDLGTNRDVGFYAAAYENPTDTWTLARLQSISKTLKWPHSGDLSRLNRKANGKYQRETPSFPSLDGCRLDQSPPPPLGLIAHMKRIPICEVFGDVPVIGERYVRTFFCQAHPISIVFEFMGGKSNSRFLPTTHDGKHLDSSRRHTLTTPTMTSWIASNKRGCLWNGVE